MSIFGKVRKQNISNRKSDEAIYSIIAQEMEDGFRNNGLWIKALEQAGGNKERQVAEYIKLRAQSLKDEVSILSASFEAERQRISRDLDIEEFVTMLSSGSPVQKIEAYFSGISPQGIQYFINLPDACDDYPIHIAIKKGR
jgi:hypothetical protein